MIHGNKELHIFIKLNIFHKHIFHNICHVYKSVPQNS